MIACGLPISKTKAVRPDPIRAEGLARRINCGTWADTNYYNDNRAHVAFAQSIQDGLWTRPFRYKKKKKKTRLFRSARPTLLKQT